MANVPPNDPNVDASAIVPAPVNLYHAPAQPDAEEKEEDPEEEEEDLKEDPEEDDDDVMEMDDEAKIIDPYMDDGSNNPPPPNFKDEETPPTSLVILDADGQPIPPVASFGQNFHFDESSSTTNLLTGNSKIDLSDRLDEYEGSKVFKDKKVLEKELGNQRNGKEFYQEFGEYMCRMQQNGQKSEDSFPLPFSSQDREPPAEPSARPIPAPYPDDPYVVTRDAAIVVAAVATSGIDDDDDTAPMDSYCLYMIWICHDFMKCNLITFHGNKGAVGLIRWIEKTEMVFTVATLGIEAVTRKTVKEMDISSYTTRFNELMILYPGMVPTKRKKVEAFIRRLSKNIKGEVTSSEPTTLNKAESFQGGSSGGGGNNNSNRNNNNYPSNRNYNNNCKNNQNQYQNPNQNHQNNQSQGNVRAMTNVGNQNTNEAGQNVKCNKCGMQHYGNCPIKCNKCGKIGHKARDCWSKVVATGRSRARGQAYALRDGDQNLGSNVVTGTFLLNNRYARVLFDSGSNKSFVNVNFSNLIDIEPVKVGHSYEVELADGKVVSTNTILRGCALNLVNHLFKIDLIPIEISTFDVIIGNNWLILHDAVIVCGKKKVHVPLNKRTLVAKVIEKESAERRLEDVPVICKFPDVFPEDLPGLPPPRQVEFEIELVPRAAVVARAPYWLAPLEMKELA
uniref:CCHC-type domain-containing protein n=1 Tax=Tanacetum cinerariifolium TaxID=118510 RepID=A0A6L2KUP3_TANCI|nr:hypothetical protein [Tanacetum cinerariifolium]